MAIPRGRSVIMLVYSIMGIAGLTAGGSGFLFMIALQLDLLSMIVLYEVRPERAQLRGQPDATMIFIGSVPLLLFNYVLATSLGYALNEYEVSGSFLDAAHETWGTPMAILAGAYAVSVIMDRVYYGRHDAYWPLLPGMLASKGLIILVLGWLSFILLYLLGEGNVVWLIPCLIGLRLLLEFLWGPKPVA